MANCLIVNNFNVLDILIALIFRRGLARIIPCRHFMKPEVQEDWRILLSALLIKLLKHLASPLASIGNCVEFILNLFSNNGGLLRTIWKGLQGNLTIPKKGTETFMSFIGHLDDRLDLHKESLDFHQNRSLEMDAGCRFLADLCVMAAKIAYENKLVIQNTVTNHWKMHFVEMFNFWNNHLKRESTQAFVFCDKDVNAELVVIAFRGTETFTVDDWITDFDFSWYELNKGMGKVHSGFLEALGLTNHPSFNDNCALDVNEDSLKPLAYYSLCKILTELLDKHENAKFMVTGHSLGGALASLFTAFLFLEEKEKLMQKLLAVYTFGQPRVGDPIFADYMNRNLNKPVPTYFRVVYCNDVVPTVPPSGRSFIFKHFGLCLYYDSFYRLKILEDEPSTLFSVLERVRIRVNAIGELIQSIKVYYSERKEMKEPGLSVICRVMGVVFPGAAAHSPLNYVTAIRMGPSTLTPLLLPPAQS